MGKEVFEQPWVSLEEILILKAGAGEMGRLMSVALYLDQFFVGPVEENFEDLRERIEEVKRVCPDYVFGRLTKRGLPEGFRGGFKKGIKVREGLGKASLVIFLSNDDGEGEHLVLRMGILTGQGEKIALMTHREVFGMTPPLREILLYRASSLRDRNSVV